MNFNYTTELSVMRRNAKEQEEEEEKQRERNSGSYLKVEPFSRRILGSLKRPPSRRTFLMSEISFFRLLTFLAAITSSGWARPGRVRVAANSE